MALTKPKIIWSKQMTRKVIEMLEAAPPLWDVSSADYKDKIKRDNCLKIIATSMNLPSNEVKSKILKLRTQFSNERNKMKKLKSGAGVEEKYVTKWAYFSSLKFLIQHIKENEENIDSMVSLF